MLSVLVFSVVANAGVAVELCAWDMSVNVVPLLTEPMPVEFGFVDAVEGFVIFPELFPTRLRTCCLEDVCC